MFGVTVRTLPWPCWLFQRERLWPTRMFRGTGGISKVTRSLPLLPGEPTAPKPPRVGLLRWRLHPAAGGVSGGCNTPLV